MFFAGAVIIVGTVTLLLGVETLFNPSFGFGQKSRNEVNG